MDKMYVIFDLDNCLADDSRRIALIDWSAENPDDRYRAYHLACDDDDCPRESRIIFQREVLGGSCWPIFLTARPVYVHDQTVAWIRDELGWSRDFTLIMRNIGDHRHSADLKRDQVAHLSDYGIELSQIVRAYDDRQDVLDMYSATYNIPVVQHRIHSLDAMRAPRLTTKVAAPLRAPDILAAGAVTFRERNALYGDNYLEAGAVLAAMFPQGLAVANTEEWTRLTLFLHCFNKLSRYAQNLDRDGHHRGHKDSAHDLMVYAAMLEEVTPS